jgi:hypothetical protein
LGTIPTALKLRCRLDYWHPDRGIPAVHVIKNSSPLAGQEQNVDRLVGVDGKKAVTLLWATDVSHLFAKKKNITIFILQAT